MSMNKKRSEFIPDCDPKILEKLNKLYNLKESAEEIGSLGEANAALKMFRSIIAKYKLNIDEEYFKEKEEQKKDIITDYLIRFKERRVFWKINLASILTKHMRCKQYLSYYKKKSDNVDYMYSIMIVGLKEDIEIVKYLFKSFIYIAEKCVKDYCDKFKLSYLKVSNGQKVDTRTRARIKNDYIEGFIKGLDDALEEQDRTDSEVALALSVPEEVNSKYLKIIEGAKSNPKLNKPSIRLRLHNPKVFKEGYNEGYNTGYNRNRRLEE